MWYERKRLILLAVVAVGLGVGAVFIHGASRETSLIGRLRTGTADEKVDAIYGLERINSDAAAGAIADSAADGHPRVAGHAISALGRMGRAEYLDRIRKGADHGNAQVREATAAAIGDLGGAADVPVLIHSLADTSQGPGVRAAAAGSLGKLNDYSAMPALLHALEDPDPLVRGRAYTAVRRIIQLDVGYRANDPPAKRAKAIARLRKLYPHLRARHEAYIRRQKEREQ